MKKRVLLSVGIIGVILFISCEKDAIEPSPTPNPIAQEDTTTFLVDVNLIQSINYSHDAGFLKLRISSPDGAFTEQNFESIDIGTTQNYFSERFKVNTSYNLSVVDLTDSNYTLYQGDTIWSYDNIHLSAPFEIQWNSVWEIYESEGYIVEEGLNSMEFNFAGQSGASETPFRIQLRI